MCRKWRWPVRRWWKSSPRPPSTFSPTQVRRAAAVSLNTVTPPSGDLSLLPQRPEPSCPCWTPCQRSAGRWRIRATRRPRGCWGSAWPSTDGSWERRPTLVRYWPLTRWEEWSQLLAANACLSDQVERWWMLGRPWRGWRRSKTL